MFSTVEILIFGVGLLSVLPGGHGQLSQCRYPHAPRNGIISPPTGPYYQGAAVTYICNAGSTIVGNPVLICNAGGFWSGAEPYCDGGFNGGGGGGGGFNNGGSSGRCEPMTSVRGATVTSSTGNINRPKNGNTVNFACRTGCTYQSGLLSLVCINGQWNGQPPVCICNNNNGGFNNGGRDGGFNNGGRDGPGGFDHGRNDNWGQDRGGWNNGGRDRGRRFAR